MRARELIQSESQALENEMTYSGLKEMRAMRKETVSGEIKHRSGKGFCQTRVVPLELGGDQEREPYEIRGQKEENDDKTSWLERKKKGTEKEKEKGEGG